MGSALLDAANKRHWELIQQTEGGTAWLLQHYEAYASALAQNMRHTYLSPFTIVTPNIGETGAQGREGPWQGWPCWGLPASPGLRPVAPSLVISVVRLDKGNFAGAKLPRYEALRGERPPDLETTVILPESVFRGQWVPKGRGRGQAGASLRGPAQWTVFHSQKRPLRSGLRAPERPRSQRSWHGVSGGTRS